MSVTVTYTVLLNNTSKEHAKGQTISATIMRTDPVALDTVGMSVVSASIDMGSTSFWSGSNNNPYINIGTFGRIYVSTSVTNKTAIRLTEPSGSFSLNGLLDVDDAGTATTFYATKSTSGNVCSYPQNYASFTITATCHEVYTKSTATVTSSVAAGDVSTVSISNTKIASLSHKVTWTLGTASYESNVTTNVSSASCTIPMTWLEQIPESLSAAGSVTVETFSPSGASLGTNTYPFTVTVPDTIVPSITLTKERIDNTVPVGWGIYVQGKSGIRITASAEAGTGSSIAGYTIFGGATGSQAGNVFIINTIAVSGTVTFTVKVTDKRGRSASADTTITVYEYTAPTLSLATAFRCSASGTANENGTYASVKLSGSIAPVAGKNTKALSVAYAESGSATFSSATTLSDNATAIIGGGSLNTGKSYQVRFRVTDAFGYTEKIVNISTAAYTVFFKEGGNAVAFGKVAEHDNALEINGDWAVYHGSNRLDGTVAISRGGTGATTVAGARNALGLGNTSGAVPIANGGTGATTVAGARNALGLGNTSGAVPVTNGGTGATDAATARTNLGITLANLGAAASSHDHDAGNITSGTLDATHLPFKYAMGSASVSGSKGATIDYSSAGFAAVPYVFVSYSTTGTNWSGDNGALKVHSKTATGCIIIVGGSFSTLRNIDWFVIGT